MDPVNISRALWVISTAAKSSETVSGRDARSHIPISRIGCTRVVRRASVVGHCFDRLDVFEVDAVGGLLVMLLVLGFLGGRNEIIN